MCAPSAPSGLRILHSAAGLPQVNNSLPPPRYDAHNDGPHDCPHEPENQDVTHDTSMRRSYAWVENGSLGTEDARMRRQRSKSWRTSVRPRYRCRRQGRRRTIAALGTAAFDRAVLQDRADTAWARSRPWCPRRRRQLCGVRSGHASPAP